ncbi:MAG: hypothetical protein M2R45_00565 [Verrucomicrobia subdivision 3 bacterium]|nr:hypothetical protein [Limisphaerales bacterium]MCS1413557.1 hypothetical protein [Limisphaerales bacterium]
MKKLFLFGPLGKGERRSNENLGFAAAADDFEICLVLRHKPHLKDRNIWEAIKETGIGIELESKLFNRINGIALMICELDIFASGCAQQINERGLKFFLERCGLLKERRKP